MRPGRSVLYLVPINDKIILKDKRARGAGRVTDKVYERHHLLQQCHHSDARLSMFETRMQQTIAPDNMPDKKTNNAWANTMHMYNAD